MQSLLLEGLESIFILVERAGMLSDSQKMIAGSSPSWDESSAPIFSVSG